MVKIENLKKDQVKSVAKIHKDFLSTGFLSKMSSQFLEKMYEGLLKSNESFILVATEDEVVLGFVASSTNVKRLPKNMLTNLWGKTIFEIIKRPKILPELFKLPLYPGFSDSQNLCEVLSIAIIPEARGKGIGKKLIYETKSKLKENGYKGFNLSVRENMKEANSFYTKIGLKKIKSSKFLGETINFYQGSV